MNIEPLLDAGTVPLLAKNARNGVPSCPVGGGLIGRSREPAENAEESESSFETEKLQNLSTNVLDFSEVREINGGWVSGLRVVL
jgi:hypothetical protein